jgi:hypothetical protein
MDYTLIAVIFDAVVQVHKERSIAWSVAIWSEKSSVDGWREMSAANEARKRVAQAALAIGALLLLPGVFTHSGWGIFALLMGGALVASGAIMLASVSVIDAVPWLIRVMSHLSEPVWDGELIHTDGDEYKIRYKFDQRGSPRFIASDVCSAVGAASPAKDVLQWGGVPLLREGAHAYFSEADVQTYLVRRAVKSHAANRLLLLIRNDVIRKVAKQCEDEQRYAQGRE